MSGTWGSFSRGQRLLKKTSCPHVLLQFLHPCLRLSTISLKKIREIAFQRNLPQYFDLCFLRQVGLIEHNAPELRAPLADGKRQLTWAILHTVLFRSVLFHMIEVPTISYTIGHQRIKMCTEPAFQFHQLLRSLCAACIWLRRSEKVVLRLSSLSSFDWEGCPQVLVHLVDAP